MKTYTITYSINDSAGQELCSAEKIFEAVHDGAAITTIGTLLKFLDEKTCEGCGVAMPIEEAVVGDYCQDCAQFKGLE